MIPLTGTATLIEVNTRKTKDGNGSFTLAKFGDKPSFQVVEVFVPKDFRISELQSNQDYEVKLGLYQQGFNIRCNLIEAVPV